jgi:head-tail adaptor
MDIVWAVVFGEAVTGQREGGNEDAHANIQVWLRCQQTPVKLSIRLLSAGQVQKW